MHYVLLALVIIAGITSIVFLIKDNSTETQGLILGQTKTPELPTEVNPNFMTQVNECFMPTAAVYGYTLRTTSGFRSFEEQDNLFEQGRTVNGHIVTEAPAGKSIHNYGYAIDVVDRFREFEIDWEKLGRIAVYCGLEQGPEGDLPHFEHRSGLTTDQFQQGMRPPLLSLPCQILADRYAAEEKLTKQDLNECSTPNF